jgi:ABC-type multidrug transport system fused ATPase/permease subunit
MQERPDVSKYWERLDELFYRTLGYAERSFKVNLYINMLIVVAGCVLVIYSMLYGWLKGLDAYSLTFGALGVLSFVSSFYLAPHKKIQRTIGDLTQIQVFYRTYCAQWENIMDWARENKDMTLEQLEALNKQLEERSGTAIEKIEKFLG